MNIFKQIVSAFIVGGLFAVMGQGLMSIFAMSLGGDSVLIVPLTLVSVGLIGGVLFIAGIYQKIEKIGTFGAILPFCGLVAAIGSLYAGTKAQTGSSGAAAKAGIQLALYVLGIGTILSIIIGAVAFFTI